MTLLQLFPAAGSRTVSPDFAGHTLIVPAISIGSVPQLAVDLLVHNPKLGLRYVGTFDTTTWCLPYACPEDYVPGEQRSGSSQLGLPIQLYSNTGARLTVIQQRSPILKSAKQDFVRALAQWSKSVGIAQILVLSSLDAALRVDAEMDTPLVQLLATSSASSSPLLKTLAHSFPTFNPQQATTTLHAPRPSSGEDSTALPPLPGAGATRLFLRANAAAEIPAGALLLFASEGDNRGDAHALATMLLDVLRRSAESSGTQDTDAGAFIQNSAFKEPRSWLTVFGQRMDQTIYG
ncbi:hypothetical protein V8E36_002087 [Tilletia maclaganii]